MIKISALNDDCEEDSDSEVEVSKEALEQIALQQYAKVLDLQRKGNLTEATQLLKDLLDTELLYDIKKPASGEKVTGSLLNLKYLCYKNLASLLTTACDYDGAIEAYNAAAELDDTDITLWHRLGLVALQAKYYETALYAFQRGVARNPRHWPCIDKLVIILLGLNYKEQCLATIHDALQLDPGYMRGIVYQHHIYKTYSHMREYMVCINPIYKYDDSKYDQIDETKAEKLLKEADEIQEAYVEQQKAETYKYITPNLKLTKPISRLSWQAVGDSLIHMHNYITEHCFSHACFIEISFENEHEDEKMEICEESDDNKNEENITDSEKVTETGSENEINDLSDKDKAVTDSEKVEYVDIAHEPTTENVLENKLQKKTTVRRRGNVLNNLKEWGWYERKSLRKKPVDDDNIYEMLRRMVPLGLIQEGVQKKEMHAKKSTPETSDIDLEDNNIDKSGNGDKYFNNDKEKNDVKLFIDKYTENKRDIIDLLKDYLSILATKWRTKWPEGLSKIFFDANKCYSNHISIPACTDNNKEALLHYTSVNILIEELALNEKINSSSEEKKTHELNVIESIDLILTLKPHIFTSTDCLEMILRSLWIKLHIYILNACEELALDCSYHLLSEFNAMGAHHDTYNLSVVNFTFKSEINENVILEYTKCLERNKKLSIVMNLYKQGNYEEVLSIVTESFEYYKTVAKKKDDMPLDFSVQLSLILDTYWALGKVDCCFKWSLICLHEALKHYFRLTSGSTDYEKWSLTVNKILICMEHIFNIEGLSCLEFVTQNELAQGLDDLIRIIGHQVETNATEMPFDSVSPWIIMHYILQREEDQGRSRSLTDSDKVACDEVPNPLMVLFIAHEHLGERNWCCKSDGKLLYFILDTVVPRLRSPSLSKALEQISQYLEQCVYCLYGHPKKKTKHKNLQEHNASPQVLDWKRAQQLYEIFRPIDLPPLEGKVSGISHETKCLFHRILSLLPAECDPSKYVPEIEKYIKGIEHKLPLVPPLLPYKMKDIYFLLGDYYFKKTDSFNVSIKYNTLDIIINNDRFKSWAQLSSAKAANLERALNLYTNINNERDFLNPAKTTIRCFERSLELDKSHRSLWQEYGNFVYSVHSFSSRLLKQASESLKMEDFEALEKQKEKLLVITYKCFNRLRNDLNNSNDSDKSSEDSWHLYYMLGKVAEKRNKSPSVYLNCYLHGVKNLEEAGAVYPSKISYNSQSHLSIEVLELHYRIHASILKYIEQHENKPIPASVGKVFLNCLEQWEQGPFRKKRKKDTILTVDGEINTGELPAVHAANILKRSVSDAGEEDNLEAKRLKLEAAAAKVRRSASYDTERIGNKELPKQTEIEENDDDNKQISDMAINDNRESGTNKKVSKVLNVEEEKDKYEENSETNQKNDDKNQDSSSSSSSSSSSDSNSSESSSDSSSESTKDTDTSSKSSQDTKSLTDEEIKKIVSTCLDALEDCASRYVPHYKALYRLAHYHFYYKKGKDIERCRDLMLSTFISRSGKKMTGLFCERKSNNFFNNIWVLRSQEIERAGGFPFHMNRSVLLTLEILKEIDDHKTLLDISLYLQNEPDLDKKYLKDSDREELAQQAFTLCVLSLKGQLQKFSQQADIKSNQIERQALKCLMLDIKTAHQNVQKHTQKHPNLKQFVNLLVDAYKLICRTPITETMNLVDLSMKYVSNLKQQAPHAVQNVQKKQNTKAVENTKTITVAPSQPKVDPKPPSVSPPSGLPKISPHEMAAAFQNYVPMLNDPVLSQLSLSYISALAGYGPIQNSLQSTLQTSLQNSFQAEFYRQFMGQNFSSYMSQQKKQKRGPKQASTSRNVSQIKPSKSFSASSTAVTKATPTPVITSFQKSASTPLTPSMGTVLSTLPASMTSNLSSFGAHSSGQNLAPQAHMSSTSSNNAPLHTKPPMPHQQVSPGKTLQEKLAERQKCIPTAPKFGTQDINASISRLPSSLTITKTSAPKQPLVHGKKTEVKKSLAFEEVRPKPISSDEVIVLDDD